MDYCVMIKSKVLGRGQAGVNGGRELSELCVSPGSPDATRGLGGWRRLVGGGAGQLWGSRPWQDWAPAPKSGAKRNWAGPTWIRGPPSLAGADLLRRASATQWRPAAGACLEEAPGGTVPHRRRSGARGPGRRAWIAGLPLTTMFD
ncbi:hypothetical protein NDU88_005381 [Pleurodeles waltl]|uniref:Uncharacterized protein n=1 Tax=Pleurodeles waltl TaxID=8319 RepID=A0AAV7QEK8_PLEWA|nr:hypothetical protein NDU88_005381 [Pleurodeles waltl]